ncbi:MAG: acyltransferase family protein [Micromonosporaceae bacterium]|nr:acyltransferase family protein [Micromonosporaceae bacterium]
MLGRANQTLDDLVRGTPPTRDRYVDFLRAASILVVVVGHWIMLLIIWDPGVIRSISAIGRVPWAWLLTWLLQVMPVFFFVGGYANYVAFQSSRRRGESVTRFIRARTRRLLAPSLVFLGVWAVIQIALHVGDLAEPTAWQWGEVTLLRGVRPPGQTIPFGPLWFLLVYLVVVVASPLTIALHQRYRWWVIGVMVAGAAVVDLIGLIGGHPLARFLNVAFVFFLPHQLGHFYADGTIGRWSRRVAPGMAAVGMTGLVALTNPWLFRPFGDVRFEWFPRSGHYPRSLLGTDVGEISNAYPPTLIYLLVGVWLIGLALLARPLLEAWLTRPGPWRATVAVNSRIMTLFLWHMTAYLIAILALWPLGFGRQQDPTLRWWAERPLWVLAPAAVLLVLVAIFGRYEVRGRIRRPAQPSAGEPMQTESA